jgi:hypothetical protein
MRGERFVSAVLIFNHNKIYIWVGNYPDIRIILGG